MRATLGGMGQNKWPKSRSPTSCKLGWSPKLSKGEVGDGEE